MQASPAARRRVVFTATALVGAAATLFFFATSGSPARAQLAAPSACSCTATDVGRGIRMSNCQCGSAQCFLTDTSAGTMNLQCVR